MHFLPVLYIHVQQTSLSCKVIQLTVYFVCSAVHGLLMADTTHSCNITALCLTKLPVNTFINLSIRTVRGWSHLKIPIWANIYRLITKRAKNQ